MDDGGIPAELTEEPVMMSIEEYMHELCSRTLVSMDRGDDFDFIFERHKASFLSLLMCLDAFGRRQPGESLN